MSNKSTHRKIKLKNRVARSCPLGKEIRFGTTYVFISIDEDFVDDDGTLEYVWTVKFRPSFDWWESDIQRSVWNSEKTLAKAQVQSLRAAEKLWTKAKKKMLSLVKKQIQSLNKEVLRLEKDRIKILGML